MFMLPFKQLLLNTRTVNEVVELKTYEVLRINVLYFQLYQGEEVKKKVS